MRGASRPIDPAPRTTTRSPATTVAVTRDAASSRLAAISIGIVEWRRTARAIAAASMPSRRDSLAA